MGLLFQASPRFRANFEQHLNNLLAADPLTLQNPAEEHHFFMSKHDAKTNSIDTFNVPPVFDNRGVRLWTNTRRFSSSIKITTGETVRNTSVFLSRCVSCAI